MVRATPGRCDSRRKRGGCDGRATATEPDMLVVTELKLVNRQWGGRGTGSRPGQLQPTVVWPAVAGERDRGAGASVRTMPEVLLAVRDGE